MARVFIAGSTNCLGRAAARALTDERYEFVLNARSHERAAALDGLTPRGSQFEVQAARHVVPLLKMVGR